MSIAIIIAIVAALFCYATGKLIEQQPASRIIQGVTAIIGALVILSKSGLV